MTEWTIKRLQDVAEITMGQSPPGESYNNNGEGVPFLQGKAEFGSSHPNHQKYTTNPKKVAFKDSILMSVRAPVGDVNFADRKYCIGRGLASINPLGDNDFLYYYLVFIKNKIKEEGTGSTFKAINKTKLQNLEIEYPPLSEQKQIAAALSAVQEAKEKTEKVIEATKELKKSMMKHLFTYGPVGIKESGEIETKNSAIGIVPDHWKTAKTSDFYDFSRKPRSLDTSDG